MAIERPQCGTRILQYLNWTSSAPGDGEAKTEPIRKFSGGPKSAVAPEFVTTLQRGADYRVSIPHRLLEEDWVFSFQFTGAYADNPADGTTFTIDGVTFGYQTFQPRPTQNPGGMLVVREGTSAVAQWLSLNALITPGANHMVHGIRVSVAFHRKENTYDVYIHNALVQKGLPLSANRDDKGSFVVSPGKAVDAIRIMGIQVGHKPISLVQFPVDAEGRPKHQTKAKGAGN